MFYLAKRSVSFRAYCILTMLANNTLELLLLKQALQPLILRSLCYKLVSTCQIDSNEASKSKWKTDLCKYVNRDNWQFLEAVCFIMFNSVHNTEPLQCPKSKQTTEWGTYDRWNAGLIIVLRFFQRSLSRIVTKPSPIDLKHQRISYKFNNGDVSVRLPVSNRKM